MFFHPALMNVLYADTLAAQPGSEVLLEYDNGDAAAIAGSQVVYYGFPVEAVPAAEDRARILSDAISRFDL